MILREVHIEGFGCLVNQRFKFGERLTVVAGPNESGKTTLVECIVRLLYGYPEHAYAKPLEERRPWKSRTFSAALIYALDDGRVLETRRDFSRPDVPTQTNEYKVMRPVADLTGARKASPGATLLHLSLEAYEAAGVMRSGDFARRPDAKDAKAHQALAERISALVGSAGDAGANAAIERLDLYARELGSERASSKPLSVARERAYGARDALETYQRDAEQARHNLVDRATLAAERDALAERARTLSAHIDAAQLAALRKQIAEAESADASLAGAFAERDSMAVSPEMLERAKRIDPAIDAWRSAKSAEAVAIAGAQANEDERKDVEAQIKRCDGRLVELEATVKRNADAIERLTPEAAGVRVSAASLSQLEAQSERADELEAAARIKETQMRVARSRQRPNAIAAFIVIVASLVVLGFGAVTQIAPLLYAGLGAMALGAGLLALFLAAQRRRNTTDRTLDAQAHGARTSADEAAETLARECAALQVTDIRAVRRASAVQSEIDKFAQARAGAEEMAEQTRRQHALLDARLKELERSTQSLAAAQQRAAECEAALKKLLDEARVPGEKLDTRVANFREARTELERALKTEREVGGLREARAGALGGRSLDDLHAQAASLQGRGVEAAAGDVAALQSEQSAVAAKQRTNESESARVAGELKSFDGRYEGGGAPLEERLAAFEAEEARLACAREAALIARDAIEKAKDAVHKDFAPHLNALAGPALAQITNGRYQEVAVDPKDFALRVRAPEHGAAVEMGALSTGTQEQLTLVLRAATAQALGSGERVPLLLDDALAHADERRLPAAVRQLAAISQRQQVLLLTQRESVVSAARDIDGVCIIHLSGPAAGAAANAT